MWGGRPPVQTSQAALSVVPAALLALRGPRAAPEPAPSRSRCTTPSPDAWTSCLRRRRPHVPVLILLSRVPPNPCSGFLAVGQPGSAPPRGSTSRRWCSARVPRAGVSSWREAWAPATTPGPARSVPRRAAHRDHLRGGRGVCTLIAYVRWGRRPIDGGQSQPSAESEQLVASPLFAPWRPAGSRLQA